MKTTQEGRQKISVRLTADGERVSAPPDVVFVAKSGIRDSISVFIDSPDGAVTLRRAEAEALITALKAALEES